jgi:4'-phosphopantetheinyl transferase
MFTVQCNIKKSQGELKFLWMLGSTNWILSSKDVHVWCAALEQPDARVQQLAKTLSEDECSRASRFYFDRDRNHFIVGRGLLRTILSRYTNIAAHQIQFCYGSRGKPSLANPRGKGTLQFNVSHSQGLALYAITRDRRIGIDLEYIRPTSDVESLAKRFFSASEYAAISSLPPNQKQEAFFNAWTRKEAYIKATGEGLAQLEQVEVSLIPGEPAKLLNIKQDAQAAANWSLQALTPATGYIGALAVEGHDWHLKCWQWL